MYYMILGTIYKEIKMRKTENVFLNYRWLPSDQRWKYLGWNTQRRQRGKIDRRTAKKLMEVPFDDHMEKKEVLHKTTISKKNKNYRLDDTGTDRLHYVENT